MTSICDLGRPAARVAQLLGFNLLTGIVLAIVGWLIGNWIGGPIHAPSIGYSDDGPARTTSRCCSATCSA